MSKANTVLAIACLSAVFAAAPAAGQSSVPAAGSSEPATIWNDLKAGMTKDQVRALYPTKRTPIADGCFAVVNGDYDKGKLTRVNLEWSVKDTSKQCGAVITLSLLAKYGQPLETERQLKANTCGNRYARGLAGALAGLCEATGGDEPDQFTYARWQNDGVEIVLKRDSDSEATWWLVYRPAVQADPQAAAKL